VTTVAEIKLFEVYCNNAGLLLWAGMIGPLYGEKPCSSPGDRA